MVATGTTAPSFLQDRVACGLPLPRVELAPVAMNGQSNDGEDKRARRELRTALTFLVGMEGAACLGTSFGWCWTC